MHGGSLLRTMQLLILHMCGWLLYLVCLCVYVCVCICTVRIIVLCVFGAERNGSGAAKSKGFPGSKCYLGFIRECRL